MFNIIHTDYTPQGPRILPKKIFLVKKYNLVTQLKKMFCLDLHV